MNRELQALIDGQDIVKYHKIKRLQWAYNQVGEREGTTQQMEK